MKTAKQKSVLAKFVIVTGLLSLLCLVLLHFVSPEFDPSWRMASEYANGNYKYLISLFFIFWGLASCSLAYLIWYHATTLVGKSGVALLFISGIGEGLAALFDVNHSLHGFAGLLGVPTLPIAALLISYHLAKKEEWSEFRKPFLFSAHATWLSLVLMIITMVVMMNGFEKAGIEFKEGSEPPKFVPEGVIAIGGYANRILILAYIYWLILIAKSNLRILDKEEIK